MSVDALSWAFRLKLKPTEKLVLLSYADRADQFGRCFSGNDDTERRTGLTRPTITKATAVLNAAGLLQIFPRYAKNGRQTSNLYVLCIGRAGTVGMVEMKALDLPEGDVTSLQGGCKEFTPPPVRSLPPNLTVTKEPSLEPSLLLSNAAGSEAKSKPAAFEEFWQAYPKCKRKVGGRKEAEKAFLRALKSGATEKQIIGGTRDFPWGADPDYYSAPAVFLNKGSWQVDLSDLNAISPTGPAADDPWGCRTWAQKVPDTEMAKMDATRSALCLNGYDLVESAVSACRIAGIPPNQPVNLAAVADWLRDDIHPDTIDAAIKGRPNPSVRSMSYFDTRVREAHARQPGLFGGA